MAGLWSNLAQLPLVALPLWSNIAVTALPLRASVLRTPWWSNIRQGWPGQAAGRNVEPITMRMNAAGPSAYGERDAGNGVHEEFYGNVEKPWQTGGPISPAIPGFSLAAPDEVQYRRLDPVPVGILVWTWRASRSTLHSASSATRHLPSLILASVHAQSQRKGRFSQSCSPAVPVRYAEDARVARSRQEAGGRAVKRRKSEVLQWSNIAKNIRHDRGSTQGDEPEI